MTPDQTDQSTSRSPHASPGGTQQARDQQARDQQALAERMARIRHKILVMSGKGGVGKSTVAVNLAFSLSRAGGKITDRGGNLASPARSSLVRAGRKVGLLDVDIHGPNVPMMLHLDGRSIMAEGDVLKPVSAGNLKVMSIGFLLQNPATAVVWRGPLKAGVIRQFLKDVAWGDLDFLVIDCPPGTGDEPLTVVQSLPDEDEGGRAAVLVTTPQDLALLDVRKSVDFCRQLSLPVLGVIENMSGLVCPHCGETVNVFKTGGGERLAKEMNVPFLGRVPLDARLVQAGDSGEPFVERYPETKAAHAFEDIVKSFLEM